MEISVSQVKTLYVYNDNFFLSFDDAEVYFESAGEEGYNGLPELTERFTSDQIPLTGRIWVDSFGIYPNRSLATDFDEVKLTEVTVTR